MRETRGGRTGSLYTTGCAGAVEGFFGSVGTRATGSGSSHTRCGLDRSCGTGQIEKGLRCFRSPQDLDRIVELLVVRSGVEKRTLFTPRLESDLAFELVCDEAYGGHEVRFVEHYLVLIDESPIESIQIRRIKSTDDARLTLENAISAAEHGALVANHTAFERFLMNTDSFM